MRRDKARRKATQAWQLKVPDHEEPKYEEINAWFYTTQAAGKGLKGSTIDYLRNLDGTYNGLSWGQAISRKMMLRWGLKLQLINMMSVTKMFDNFAGDLASMIIDIYEEETGAPPQFATYTPEPKPWGEMSEVERRALTAVRRAKSEAHRLTRKKWDDARTRVNRLISPAYQDWETKEYYGTAEIEEKKNE